MGSSRAGDRKGALSCCQSRCVYAIEGMRDDAISCLERAIDKGYGHKEWILHDSDLNSLRNDKRFKALLERM